MYAFKRVIHNVTTGSGGLYWSHLVNETVDRISISYEIVILLITLFTSGSYCILRDLSQVILQSG